MQAFIIFTFLVLFVLLFMNNTKENFFFEVTPWKKTCLGYNSVPCKQCCKPGFHGKPVSFNYCSDADLNYTIAGDQINTGIPRLGV